ncbi:MAG: dihydrolipoamide acetyltransferase family protein [Thermoleophilia bacterium]
MAFEFKFPDVGEGITEGELLSWKVEEGDVISEDATLAEVETDKAVVEIPSPRGGRVVRLHAEQGDVIEVGQTLVTIEESEAEASPEPEAPEEGEEGEGGEEEFYSGSVVGRLEEAPEEEEEERTEDVARGREEERTEDGGRGRRAEEAERPEGERVLALPSVRALAKEMGVDLAQVRGTGPGGRILKQDVEDHAEAAAYGRTTVHAPSVPLEEQEAAEAWMGGRLERDTHGVVERVAFKGVRRSMARRMAESLAKQAQVTSTEEADVTILRRIREKERSLAAERGVRLTYLAFVVKACAVALQRFPRLNAVLEEGCDEFVLKRYYNIGIAIDTRAGLVVPNIKNADRMSIFQIAEKIVDLVERAQERTLELSDLSGGTFTITNYGAIGGIHATPATNYPEVAILGMGRIRETPAVVDGEIRIRQMLPLSLTFDHQLIDGAEASRFLNLVIGYLEDPDRLLLESV